jgi:hypothetical protein
MELIQGRTNSSCHICHTSSKLTGREFVGCVTCPSIVCNVCIDTALKEMSYNVGDDKFVCPRCKQECPCKRCAPRGGGAARQVQLDSDSVKQVDDDDDDNHDDDVVQFPKEQVVVKDDSDEVDVSDDAMLENGRRKKQKRHHSSVDAVDDGNTIEINVPIVDDVDGDAMFNFGGADNVDDDNENESNDDDECVRRSRKRRVSDDRSKSEEEVSEEEEEEEEEEGEEEKESENGENDEDDDHLNRLRERSEKCAQYVQQAEVLLRLVQEEQNQLKQRVSCFRENLYDEFGRLVRPNNVVGGDATTTSATSTDEMSDIDKS